MVWFFTTERRKLPAYLILSQTNPTRDKPFANFHIFSENAGPYI